MKKFITIALTIALFSLLSVNSASAQNTPCSGKKGGVSHCEDGKFICKDGSTSKSKKVCTGKSSAKKR